MFLIAPEQYNYSQIVFHGSSCYNSSFFKHHWCLSKIIWTLLKFRSNSKLTQSLTKISKVDPKSSYNFRSWDTKTSKLNFLKLNRRLPQMIFLFSEAILRNSVNGPRISKACPLKTVPEVWAWKHFTFLNIL